MSGEKPGVRDQIDKMAKRIRETTGVSREKAREVAKRAAMNHHHNEGRRDPNRNRR